MENKKIYVDGVDVSKCYRYQKKTGYCEGAFKPEELPFCENFDCEFKNLARKTEECERSLKRISDLEERIINHSNEIEEYCSRLADKNKECESLKEKYEELKEDRYNLNIEMYVCDRYRKALEEIEKVINNILNSCLGRNTVSCRPAHNVCGDLINILDIISRAKGEK